MRPPKVDNEEMLQGLMSVLRAKGYDGASLNELSEAAGLKKASLYHRFPGGKKQMTEAVLSYVNDWVNENIYKTLTSQEMTPHVRLTKALENIRILYHEGNAICISRSLSMESGMQLFGTQVAEGLQRWIDAFRGLALDLGWDEAKAEQAGLQTLIELQGSLVAAKGLQTTQIFLSTLRNIEKRYAGK